MINIDELLQQQDVHLSVLDLVKSNLEVVPITIYKLQSKYSNYAYTEDELDYSNDHIRQLINDIIIANLDKVKHVDNRVYKFFEPCGIYFKTPSKFIWLVRNNNLLKVVVTDVNKTLERDNKDKYILTEFVYYHEDGIYKGQTFINDLGLIKHMNYCNDKFFETEDEALNYIKEEQK